MGAIARIQTRIAEITGQPGEDEIDSAGPLRDTPHDPAAAGKFAGMVQAALAGQGGSGFGELHGPAPVAPAQIDALVGENANAEQVDPALIKAIIANESAFNANATSNVGAQGLMQLMPGTAAGLGVGDAYDPGQNVAGGTKYIKGLLDRFGGDVQKAIAAYNAGPGAVEKYHGVPPYAETQAYVRNVIDSYTKYKDRDPQP
jgi:soluble lytic murein transglycosylase-like protein